MACYNEDKAKGVDGLPDSSITKKALAQALKDLMRQRPFEKISVGDICARCEMNRKSFYYHFKDKYDLVEWIFYSEFILCLDQSRSEDGWDLLTQICTYFYDERVFYGKLLRLTGQNSFRQYFRDYLCSVVAPFLLSATQGAFAVSEESGFCVTFFSDAMLVSIMRWLTEGAHMPPEQYVGQLKSVFRHLSAYADSLSDLEPPMQGD